MLILNVEVAVADQSTHILPSILLTSDKLEKGFDLGETDAGLVVGIRFFLLEGVPSTPRKLYLQPMFPGGGVKQPQLKEEIFPANTTRPPKRHVTEYTVSLDGKPFQTIKPHPWWLPSNTSLLPYSPKELEIGMRLSTGEHFLRRAILSNDTLLDQKLDTRIHEDVPEPAFYAWHNISYPYQNKVGARIVFPVGGCIALTVMTACVSSSDLGRITHSTLTLKKHARFSPEGDRLLNETFFHQPVFVVGESTGVRTREKDLMAGKLPDVELTVRCDTEKGNVLTKSFTSEMPQACAKRPPFQYPE